MSYSIKNSIKEEKGQVYFIKERLQDIAWNCDGERSDDYDKCNNEDFIKEIYNKVADTDRWSTNYEQVFQIGDKYYKTWYSEGSTEMQDESPYEYENDWVEVSEVVPKEVVKTIYVSKE